LFLIPSNRTIDACRLDSMKSCFERVCWGNWARECRWVWRTEELGLGESPFD